MKRTFQGGTIPYQRTGVLNAALAGRGKSLGPCHSERSEESAFCLIMRDSSSPSAPQNSIAELFLRSLLVLLMVLLVGGSLGVVKARPASDEIDDVTGKYHFLSADDTLAILEEEGKLKGYIDVYQGEEESDAVLSYP